MVITNIKEQVMHQSLYSVDIFIHPLTVLQIGNVFLVVVKISE